MVSLDLSVEQPEAPLGPGNETVVVVTVSNDGQADGTAELSVETEGQGWSASLASTSVDVAAGSEETVDLTLQAPEQRNGSAANATFTVSATLTGPLGQSSDSGSVETSAQLTEAPPPPPEPFPWGWVLGGIGAMVVIGVAAILGAVVYRRETGLAVSLPEERSISPGTEGYVPVVIRNKTGQAKKGVVEIEERPVGWEVGLNRSWLLVDPGAVKRLWLSVHPPEEMETGVGTVQVSVRTEQARWHEETALMQVSVDPGADPQDPKGRFLKAPIGTPAPGAPPLPEEEPDEALERARREAEQGDEASDG